MGYKLSDKKKIPPIDLPCKKVMYNTLDDAQAMIKNINENRIVREIHAYKCSICGFWHLTSKSE
jgi:hypothetical protein